MKKPALLYAGLAAATVVAGLLAAGMIPWSDRAKEDTPVPSPSSAANEWHWQLPVYIPEPRVPADNPMTEAKFQLGRHLFYDKRLSGNGTFACASCHFQNLAFTDGKANATGSTGEHTPRSAQSIANSAYHSTLTWANFSLSSLEQQATVPMIGENPVEMGINDANKAEVVGRFAKDEDYQRRFHEAFPNEAHPIQLNNIIRAIATFERGVLSFNSKYDQVLQGISEYSEQELRGRKLFFGEQAQCSQCHSGFNFTEMTVHTKSEKLENIYRNTGLYNLDGKGAYPENNQGIIGVSGKPGDMGKFRVASLRNVAVTAPYMHDGSIATLEAVLDFYAAGGRNFESGPFKGSDGRRNPYKDERLNKIKLNPQERADIVAFLKTLTDETLLSDLRYSDPFKAGK
ncbi:MAG: di-heme enzyme [Nitrosomonadales bacterium]|nr:di-heme enzyme [Nitrosomonadales bacterium]